MEELIFEDYVNPNIGHLNNATNIITLTLKQISRGRFKIANNQCMVTILLNGERRTVVLSNNIASENFRNLVYIINIKEPSTIFLHQNIEVDKPLLECLKNYQNQFYKFGNEFKNEYWYKFYSKTKIEDNMRVIYQASWIDYEAQLTNEPIIYDELGVCGLFAMPYHMLFKFFNDECKKRYGDNLFILKTVPTYKYIYVDKEIIGDRFEVIKKYDLSSFEDVGKLIEYMISLEMNKYDAKIKDLKTENIEILRELSESPKILDNQSYLHKIINKFKLLK